MTVNYGKLVKQACNQMNRAMDEYARASGLTGTQMSIIDFIGSKSAVLQRDIEAEFNIQRSTASVLLQRMEARELVTRQAVAGDARQKAVRLTPKAERLHEMVAVYIAKQQSAMTSEFTPAECATFVRMLQYFIQLNHGEQAPSEP